MTGISSEEVVIQIAQAQLYQVENQVQTLLAQGTFVIQYAEPNRIEAKVDAVAWQLGKHVAALQVSDYIYTFTAETESQLYYCLMLPVATHEDTIADLDAILEEVTDYYGVEDVPEATGAATATQAAAGRGTYAGSVASTSTSVVYATEPPTPPPVAAGAGSIVAGFQPDNKVLGDTRLARNIQSAALFTSGLIAKGAEVATVYIAKGAQAINKRTQSNATPTAVSPATFRRLAVLGKVAAAAAALSGRVASKVADVSVGVASKLAHKAVGTRTSSNKPPGDVQQVLAATALGAAEILEAMERAALMVLDGTGRGVTSVIDHKYGSQAALVSRQSAHIAHDVLDTSLNMKVLSGRQFVRKTAKHFARRVAHNYSGQPPPGQHPAGGAQGYAAGPSAGVVLPSDVAGARPVGTAYPTLLPAST